MYFVFFYSTKEELVAASHSGCFTMQLSAYIVEGGFEIGSIETKCDINLLEGINVSSPLGVSAKIKRISGENFQELVSKPEVNRPISKLFDIEISTEATLVKFLKLIKKGSMK